MFKCDRCGSISQPKEKQITVVIEERVKKYYLPDGKESVGSEIVSEIHVCQSCALIS